MLAGVGCQGIPDARAAIYRNLRHWRGSYEITLGRVFGGGRSAVHCRCNEPHCRAHLLVLLILAARQTILPSHHIQSFLIKHLEPRDSSLATKTNSRHHIPPRHSPSQFIMHGAASLTKVHFKGSNDDFVIFVESAQAVRDWKADKSVPLAQVVNGWKIFCTHK